MQYSIQSSKIDRVDAHQVLLCLKISSLIHYHFYATNPALLTCQTYRPALSKPHFPVNHPLLKTYCIMLCVKGNLQTIFRWLIVIDFITIIAWHLPLSKGHRNTYPSPPIKHPGLYDMKEKKKIQIVIKKARNLDEFPKHDMYANEIPMN